MQMTIMNMERKQAIIEINRFLYTGKEEHYRASEATLTNLINYRDDMSQLIFRKHIPLTPEQILDIRYYTPDIEESTSVIQLYVWMFIGEETGQQKWNEATDILRNQQALGKDIYEWSKSGIVDVTALADFERQIQQYDLIYEARVLKLRDDMLDANNIIRYFVFGIITFLAISLTVFAERITRSRLRYARELYRHEEISERHRKFPETNPYPVISFGHDGTLDYYNAAAEAGFPNLSILREQHPFIKIMLHHIMYEDKLVSEVELRHVEYNDKHFDVMIRKAGVDYGYHAYVFDSSVIYQQKTEIEANLREKELLISEIHHRVNNNLAIILGFLELSERHMIDITCRRLNDLNMTRIRTVSVINRALYDHGDFTNVDFAEHLRYLEKNNKIKVSLDTTHGLVLNVNQAFSLALLLNEIIQEMRFLGCGEGMCIMVERKDDLVRIGMSSPAMVNFSIPDNDIMQLMISQLGLDWNGHVLGSNALSFKFDVREVSGAMATRHLSRGMS